MKVLYTSTGIGLVVSVAPSTISVLAAASYNSFSIVSTATLLTIVPATKSFRWTRTSQRTTVNITAGTDVTISSIALSNSSSTSVLSLNDTTLGSYLYTCEATVLETLSSASSTVTVNGVKKIVRFITMFIEKSFFPFKVTFLYSSYD